MAMKRFQMMIDPELDDALARRAAAEGVSKAGLIRSVLREHIDPLPPIEEDPLWQLVGLNDGPGPDDEYRGRVSEHVDDILYGPATAWE